MATILVTGANRGIGLELCRQYAARGDDVVAVCRRSSPELGETHVEVIDHVDVTSNSDLARMRRTIGDRNIDILVNNAGILMGDTLETISLDAMRLQFEINTLGPLRVVLALREALSEGSKIAIVTSRVGSLEDNGSGNNYGYRVSKAAANMVGVNLVHDLGPKGIAVGLYHPGLVATEMTRGNGIPPADAAAGLIREIDALDVSNAGEFRHAEGYQLPW